MKKLAMIALTICISACPVACVNDPTLDDRTSTSSSTDTNGLTDEEKKMVEDAVKTLVDTSTETGTAQ